MGETLSHITVGQVALAAVIVGGLLRFGGRAWRWAVRAVHFIDKLESIESQVYANGGSSLRDAVDRIGTTQGALAQAQEAQATDLALVRVQLEQHVTEHARQPHRAGDPPDTDYRDPGRATP
jgi:hypothetical protein